MLVHKDEGDLMGKMFEVEITSAGKHFMVGRVVKDGDVSSPGLVEPLPKGVVSGVPQHNISRQSGSKQEKFQFLLKMTLVVLLVAVLVRFGQLGSMWLNR